MDGCLLCLGLKQEFEGTILINSNKWNELNVNYVLKKYLWPMNHVTANSWICTTCWTELFDFHKFYIRIEEAHRNLGLLTNNMVEVDQIPSNSEKIEIPISALDEKPIDLSLENVVDGSKDILNEIDQSYSHWKSNVIDEQKPILKIELNEESLSGNNSLLKARKRGRPHRDTDNDTNTSKATLSQTKKYKKGKIEDLSHDVDMSICSSSKTKKRKVKESPSKEIEVSTENTASQVKNFEIKNETDLLLPPEDLKLSVDKHSSSSNGSDEESSDMLEVKSNTSSSKAIRNAKDKFLTENFKITCFLCDIPLETFYKMRKHFKEYHTEPGYIQCCNKKFYRRSILIDHVRYHLNPNYFKCSKCDAVMEDRRRLMLHIKTHEVNNGKNHRCEICGKGFLLLGVLNKHKMIHLSEEEKPFTCSGCGKNFASNYLLSNHYRSVHLKKYAKICDICGKSMRCKDVFERHMLQHEGKTPPSVNCDICGLVLTGKKTLKRHKDILHPVGGQHEYTCSICSKTSPNLRAHKRHVQYKHVMGYDYKCTICDKAFKRAPTLKEHMASHTGTILYTCPWCPKTFNSNANMHNHRKKVHPREYEEASRKRYSGNLPPNYKPPTIIQPADFMNI